MSEILEKQNKKEQEEQKEKEQENNQDVKENTINQVETKPPNVCPKQYKKIKIILQHNPAFSIQYPKINKIPSIIHRKEVLLSYKTDIPKQELLNFFLEIFNIEKNAQKVIISTLKNQEGINNFVYLKARLKTTFYIKLNVLKVKEQVVPVTYYTGRSKCFIQFMEKYLIPNDPYILQYDNVTKTIDIKRQMECQNKADIKLQEFLRKSTLVYLYGQDIIAREYLHKPILPYEVWKKKQKAHCDQLLS